MNAALRRQQITNETFALGMELLEQVTAHSGDTRASAAYVIAYLSNIIGNEVTAAGSLRCARFLQECATRRERGRSAAELGVGQ
jgi:hypothetical protein